MSLLQIVPLIIPPFIPPLPPYVPPVIPPSAAQSSGSGWDIVIAFAIVLGAVALGVFLGWLDTRHMR